MRLIYNRATQVVPWLGEKDKYTESAFGLIDTIITNALPADVGFRAEPGAIWDKPAMDGMGLPHFPSIEWEALARLFERPYFQRIWVVQELAVSSNAVARCGDLSIRWDHIEYVARLLTITGWIRALQKLYGSRVKPTFIKSISACRLGFYELKGGPGISLGLLLCSTRRFQATDPRDKIIALMGLANNVGPEKSRSIVPDYSKPIADLYRDITGHLIMEEKSRSLLSSVEDISDRQIHKLPSWVPDYSVEQRATIIGMPLSQLSFQAASLAPVSARWTTGSTVLAVNGHRQDVIETVSADSLEDLQDYMGVVNRWLDMAQPLIRRGTLSIDAFWRTIIGNNGGGIFPASKQYGKHFASYLSLTATRKQGYLDTLSFEQAHHSRVAKPMLFQAALTYIAPHRKFFTTSKGSIGLGPRSIRPRDSVCVLSGGQVPFVLRKDCDHYRLVGESYVHGLMEGQASQKESTLQESLIN